MKKLQAHAITEDWPSKSAMRYRKLRKIIRARRNVRA